MGASKYPGTDALIEQMKSMSINRLAAHYNVNRRTVLLWIVNNRLQKHVINTRPTVPPAEELLHLAQTMSHKEIAAYYNVGASTAGSWIRLARDPDAVRQKKPRRDTSSQDWVRKRLSKAEGVNGWRYSKPWSAEITSPS